LQKVAQSFILYLESLEAAFQAWSYDESKSYLCCNLSFKISKLELCSVRLIDGVSSHNAFSFYVDKTIPCALVKYLLNRMAYDESTAWFRVQHCLKPLRPLRKKKFRN